MAGQLRPGVSIAMPQTAIGWTVAMILIALAHIAVYFTLGYWLIWVDDDARGFYGGGELLGFFAHLDYTAGATPWLFAVQFVRGLIFAGLAAVIFQTLSLPRWGRIAVAALVFVAYFAAPLIVPNPFMPAWLRQLHLIETGLTCVLMAVAAGVFLRPYGSAGLKFQKLR
jgi:hypothetical protein